MKGSLWTINESWDEGRASLFYHLPPLLVKYLEKDLKKLSE